MADSQRKTANLFNPNFTRYHMGKGANNRIASVANGAMFYIEATPNTNYTIKVHTTDSTFVRLYLSNAPIVENVSESYNVISESETTINPEVTISNTGYTYLWIQVGGTWYTEHGGESIMLNTGSEPLPYEPYGWVHSLRKLTTATDTLTLPAVIYPNDTSITVGIKGNTTQSGTPSPSAPVAVNGVGERTVNLLALDSKATNQNGQERNGGYFPAGTYYILNNSSAAIFWRDGISDTSAHGIAAGSGSVVTTTDTLVVWHSGQNKDVMVAASSTSTPFEPYGYKIPISTAQGTSNIYLSEPLYKINDYADTINADGTVTRRIGKWVFNGTESWSNASTFTPPFFYIMGLTPLAIANSPRYSTNLTVAITATGDLVRVYDYDYFNQDLETFKTYLVNQYANGTPETIYYILATPTTEQITLPTIPTTDGANTITVDTTVQPSEFTATYTGWHDSSVKEYDGTDWQ